MNDQASSAPLVCPTCKRPLSPSAQGAFTLPPDHDFTESQRERVRLIVLQVLRDLRALPATIPGELG